MATELMMWDGKAVPVNVSYRPQFLSDINLSAHMFILDIALESGDSAVFALSRN